MSTGDSSTVYDLIVVGAGSGGFGAAYAAARRGLRTLVVEKADQLGGNAVRGGVNCWEMGAGGTGIPFDIYKNLKRQPEAIGVYSYGRHWCWQTPAEPYRFPGGEQVIDPARRYLDTLRRHGSKGMGKDEAFCREHWHGVPFEPAAMDREMQRLLAATGCAEVALNTAFTDVRHDGRRITGLTLSDGRQVSAASYVDGTADAHLCVALGCETLVGQEGRERWAEPSAPEQANRNVNGVTLIYRISPVATPAVEPLPDGIPADCWWKPAFPGTSMNEYPNRDRNMNMLPTMEGGEFMSLPYREAYAECERRVRAHWHHYQQEYAEFRGFRLSWLAPGLGVRESRRIVGEYVLTEHDLIAGLSGQEHADIICIADHARDTHGTSTGRAGCGELTEPYGVPYRCLIPRGWRNLAIACRAASMSSIAASSCRLSRTMMQMGQAAGTAAVVAKAAGTDLASAPIPPLLEALRADHVQLSHPMPADLRAHLAAEDA